jgi:hypothetical protein
LWEESEGRNNKIILSKLIFKKDNEKTSLEVSDVLASFQTNPTYLAKLIFQMPQNKSTKFMDSVIFTLYNYASNQREEYLLLRLFQTALQEEIKYGEGGRVGLSPEMLTVQTQATFAFPWSQFMRNTVFKVSTF